MGASKKRPSTVALNLLARPGGAPVRGVPVEDFPRPGSAGQPELSPASSAATPDAPAPGAARPAGGIKAATVGTTVYLLPAEHKRVRRLALDLDVPSVHELLLLGLDRLLAEQCQPPLARYSPPRPKKG
jgi:hypothetical protein